MEKSRKTRWILLGTAAAAIMIAAVFWCFFSNAFFRGERAAPLNVPDREEIVSIKVRSGVDTYVIEDEAVLDELANILLETVPTAKESINDSPNVKGSVSVSILCVNEEDNTGFFVYTKRKKTYIEIPYNGIWEAPPALYYYLVPAELSEN